MTDTNDDPSSNIDSDIDHFVKIYSSIIESEMSNIGALGRFEDIVNPTISSLAKDKKEEKEIEEILSDFNRAVGGVPRLIIKHVDEPKHRYDTFPRSIVGELLASVHKARRAVIKAYSQYVVVEAMRNKQKYFTVPPPESATKLIENYFWDSLEVSYFRLASFWDRAGQILDFSFFNMRSYDREGFTAIMEKIHINIEPVLDGLTSNASYLSVWEYSKNESSDGLKWVLARRNVITHAVGLDNTDPLEDGDDVYVSKYNHFEQKRAKKLSKREMNEEIVRLNFHHSKITSLFRHVILLATIGGKRSLN